jgi:NAD(P)H-dependent FMN reductase
MKLMVINGSVRESRAADRILDWALPVLQSDPELELDVVDLKEVDLPFFDEAVIPSANKGEYKNPKGTAWAKRVGEADAYLLITPEYNHGPTAVLKNALDWVYDEWRYKPAGFISYGGIAAGTRAVQQLKQNLLHLDVFPVHFNVHIPNIWNPDSLAYPGLDDNLKKVVADIKSLGQRLSN